MSWLQNIKNINNKNRCGLSSNHEEKLRGEYYDPPPPLTCKTVRACCIFHRKTKSLATRYEISAADCTIYGIQLKNKRLVRQKVYDHTILIERFVARITKSAKILIFKQHLRSLLESDMIILAQRIFPTMCISQQTLITQLFWN